MLTEHGMVAAFAEASGITSEEAPRFDMSWPSEEPWTSEPLVPEEVFYFFNEPLLFSVPVGPFKMLFQKWSEKDGVSLYTVSLVNAQILDHLRESRLSVFGAVTCDLRFVVQMEGMVLQRVWGCGKWNISPKRLPQRGVALDRFKGLVPDVVAITNFGRMPEPGEQVASAQFQTADFNLTVGWCLSSIRGLFAHLVSGFALPRRVRHLARGTLYDVVFEKVSIQAKAPIVEGDEIAVYVGEDGKPWGRPVAEFNDGRFEDVQA